jgi:hypothetical protein
LDAIKLIFVAALGFKPQEFAGAVPGYRGNPTVLFKTKEVFNIDERFADLARFSFIKRIPIDDGSATHTYDCAIRGVRGKEPTRNPYTWVKIEGADYQLNAQTIKKWLLLYGTLMTDLTEDKVDLELDAEEEELYQGVDLTTGTYSVKMSIHTPIPQFLPMDGKKIRIFYKGIPKLCSRCYGGGHLRHGCKNEEDDWLSYVDNHMIRSDLDDSYYGKWWDRIGDWRLSNDDAHRRHKKEAGEEWEREKERRSLQNERITNIIGDLHAQTRGQQRASSQPQVEDKNDDDDLMDVAVATLAGDGAEPATLPMETNPTETQTLPQASTNTIGPEANAASEAIGKKLSNLTFDKNRLSDEKRGRGRPKAPGTEAPREVEKKDKVKTRSLSLTGK